MPETKEGTVRNGLGCASFEAQERTVNGLDGPRSRPTMTQVATGTVAFRLRRRGSSCSPQFRGALLASCLDSDSQSLPAFSSPMVMAVICPLQWDHTLMRFPSYLNHVLILHENLFENSCCCLSANPDLVIDRIDEIGINFQARIGCIFLMGKETWIHSLFSQVSS